MERRRFLKNSVAVAAGAAAVSWPLSGAKGASVDQEAADEFSLKYAPHFGMFKASAGSEFVPQLEFMAKSGFTALEDNDMTKRSLADQDSIASTMTRLNMTMGVFVAHTIYWQKPNLTSGDLEKREEFLAEIKNSVEVAKRVNAQWMTVVPGHLDLRKDMGYQTANVVESLKQASAILEPHGLVMVLEPLNFRDHPGLFLTKVPQAYEICKAVDSPSCKILFDVYHQQITEGNLIPNIDLAWDEVAYFQVGDNPGRKEPTTGEINYQNVFKHLREKEYTGIIGMEHGNSGSGIAGEQAVIEAYKKVDSPA
jgi:hydroxypyruvate isomerase